MNLRAVVPLLAPVLLLPGCGAIAGSGGDGADVVTASYPLTYVAQRVAGEELEVAGLTPAGGDPHGGELSVAQVAQIENASLVIHSSGLQPAVDDAVETNAGGAVLDAAEVVELVPVGEHHDEGRDQGHGHQHGDDHGGMDPHFWLDPVRMARLGDAVAGHLAGLHPEHAGAFRDNAAELAAQLEELDSEYAEGLAECARDTVVVSHDAFGYLGKYGLAFEPVAGISPGAEPTPADLQRLQRVIREAGVTTVFTEPLTSSRLTRSLAEDLDIETATLDPIEGLTEETADEDYLSLMRQNLAALTEANQCR